MVAPGLYAARAARRPQGPTASPWSALAEPARLASRPQARRGGIDSHPAAAAPAVSAGRRQPGSRRGRSRNPKAFGPGSPPPEGWARDAPPEPGKRAGQPSWAPLCPSPPQCPQLSRPGPGVSCFASAHTPPLPVLPGSQTESHRRLIRICFPGVAASLCAPTVPALRLDPSFSCHPTLTHSDLKPDFPGLGPGSFLGACRGLEILLKPLPHENRRRHELKAIRELGLAAPLD